MVVDFVRRLVDLPEGTTAVYAADKTAKNHRALVRKRLGAKYKQARARQIVESAIRVEAASKNRPADLINVALEKVVEAGLELPAFSALDAMASRLRKEVNASICAGIHDRMSLEDRARLLRLLEVYGLDGTTLFNQLKKSAQGPSWSHFKKLVEHLQWIDSLGASGQWLKTVAPAKVTDFAGEAEVADAPLLRDYAPVKRVAMLACLVHKARMRTRDDLATMFCKRVATKVKRAKEELKAIREQQQAIVEGLLGNYETLLRGVDDGGPAQEARETAAELTGDALKALEGLDEAARPRRSCGAWAAARRSRPPCSRWSRR